MPPQNSQVNMKTDIKQMYLCVTSNEVDEMSCGKEQKHRGMGSYFREGGQQKLPEKAPFKLRLKG